MMTRMTETLAECLIGLQMVQIKHMERNKIARKSTWNDYWNLLQPSVKPAGKLTRSGAARSKCAKNSTVNTLVVALFFPVVSFSLVSAQAGNFYRLQR